MPACTRIVHASIFPLNAAQCKGVQPDTIGHSMSARFYRCIVKWLIIVKSNKIENAKMGYNYKEFNIS